MRRSLALLVSLVVPQAASSQADPRPEILILGTYHMANPGLDIHNMQADDVLSPKRQQEMTQLMEVLKRFNPTKIAIEADVGSKRLAKEYADYLTGKYSLTRNEIDQIAYRLGKELGKPVIYGVDADAEFPYTRVLNYAKANGLKEKFDSIAAHTGQRVKEQGDFLASHTVLQMLQYMNSDSLVARDLAEYFSFVPFGEPYEFAGPDLLAAFYQRNIRIYHNIRAIADSPGDRVLVIFGAGHLGWLRQDVANDPGVRLRKLAELAPMR
jgi:hypothetical protein